jgi:hypothetical protein
MEQTAKACAKHVLWNFRETGEMTENPMKSTGMSDSTMPHALASR